MRPKWLSVSTRVSHGQDSGQESGQESGSGSRRRRDALVSQSRRRARHCWTSSTVAFTTARISPERHAQGLTSAWRPIPRERNTSACHNIFSRSEILAAQHAELAKRACETSVAELDDTARAALVSAIRSDLVIGVCTVGVEQEWRNESHHFGKRPVCPTWRDPRVFRARQG
jgi:hypothetical protein